MSHLVNPLVPELSGSVSPRTERVVAELRRSGSPFATHDEAALRREDRASDRPSLLRPPFVRDAEKVLHMRAYNRLAGKTQVFSFRANDDLCRRGLHVQLVSRVARDIGGALGLNLDLIEAMALGHDIGHTPFGHAGERFLNDVLHARTGRWFFHNVQSARVLDVLYGRNLTLQTLDGVICHNGEFERQVLSVGGLSDFADFDRMVGSCWAEGDATISHLRPSTLEGCVVRIADIIAYVGKDRQDAIRAHLLDERAFDDGLGGAYNAWALSALVADVVEQSAGKDHIALSEAAFAELRRAKRENYEKIYGAAEVDGELSRQVGELFERLYLHELESLKSGDEDAPVFRHHIVPVSESLAHYGRSYRWEDDLELTVVDFISSMTDDYFMAICERLFEDARGAFPRRSFT